MKEQSILKHILLSCAKGPCRLFRMNVGMGWVGQATKLTTYRTMNLKPGDVVVRNGRPFHAGFEGMSDLVGWRSVTITPDMVGQKVAIYSAVEVKGARGQVREAQEIFIKMVESAGGIAGIARSEEEAKSLLRLTQD